jgi:hypothetical protein
MSTTSEVLLPLYKNPNPDPNYVRMVAAVVSGCLMFLLLIVMFLIISLIIRFSVRAERRKLPKEGRRKSLGGGGGDGQFYSGVPYSAQALVSNLSGTSINAASDVHLDAQGGRSVYHNRGFEGEELHRGGPIASTSSAGSDGHDGHFEESYKPIEIGGKKKPTEHSHA